METQEHSITTDYSESASAVNSQQQVASQTLLLQSILAQALQTAPSETREHRPKYSLGQASAQASGQGQTVIYTSGQGLSGSPVMPNSVEKRSSGNNNNNFQVITISPYPLPDLTEGQCYLDPIVSPQSQPIFHAPPPLQYHQRHQLYSRSGSTSPERRESVGSYEKQGAVGVENGGGREAKEKVPRHKRASHINAEHRRRFKIQVKTYSR